MSSRVDGRGRRGSVRAWLGLVVPLALLVACSSSVPDSPPEPAPGFCSPGTKTCNGECVDAADPLFGCRAETCAPCNATHAELVVCRGEQGCALDRCAPGYGDCDGRAESACETDLADPSSCGACGVTCPSDQSCSRSGCGGCAPNEASCNRRCVDLESDPANCGACGKACLAAPNGIPACIAGRCVLKCSDSFADCDGNVENGCEPLAPYYLDADGDTFGNGKTQGYGCTAPPGFSLLNNDCLDTNKNVHPGQAAFFGVGYVKNDGKISFDYDCNGKEEPVAGSQIGACSPVGCFVGYAPKMPARGADTLGACGSGTRYTCTGSGSLDCPSVSAPMLTCR